MGFFEGFGDELLKVAGPIDWLKKKFAPKKPEQPKPATPSTPWTPKKTPSSLMGKYKFLNRGLKSGRE